MSRVELSTRLHRRNVYNKYKSVCCRSNALFVNDPLASSVHQNRDGNNLRPLSTAYGQASNGLQQWCAVVRLPINGHFHAATAYSLPQCAIVVLSSAQNLCLLQIEPKTGHFKRVMVLGSLLNQENETDAASSGLFIVRLIGAHKCTTNVL